MDGDEQEVYADSATAGKKIASLLGDKNRILVLIAISHSPNGNAKKIKPAKKHAMSSNTPSPISDSISA